MTVSVVGKVIGSADAAATPTITGGTIDGAVIGGTVPAAGTFTQVNSTGAGQFGDDVSITGDLIVATGATSDVTIGKVGNYGIVTLNEVLSLDTALGIAGGSVGDDTTLYEISPVAIKGRINGNNITDITATGFAVTGVLSVSGLPAASYADDAAAAVGGIPVGGLYHTAGAVKVRLA